MTKAPSLEEFDEVAPKPVQGYPPYLSSLPQEIQTQLLQSTAGHATAERWLHDLGYTRATQQMIRGWRNKRGWSKA